MGHKATEAQLKIFDFVKNGKGNGIIDAVAGAGKTSTLMGCISQIWMMSFIVPLIQASAKSFRRSSKQQRRM